MTETLKEVHESMQRKMNSAMDSLKKEFISVRTGRATPAMLDSIKVDYYGTPTQLSQVGTITTPEPQLLMINPWEKKLLKDIERAIQQANLGLNVSNDGNFIRAVVPPLTQDRRKELVKGVKKMGEESKVAIRNVRRDANDQVKKLEKDKKISQDDEKAALEQTQKVTDSFIKNIDELVSKKETELLTT